MTYILLNPSPKSNVTTVCFKPNVTGFYEGCKSNMSSHEKPKKLLDFVATSEKPIKLNLRFDVHHFALMDARIWPIVS